MTVLSYTIKLLFVLLLLVCFSSEQYYGASACTDSSTRNARTSKNTALPSKSRGIHHSRASLQFAAFAFPNPIEIIDRDFKALTRKVTAYHILLPKSDQVAISLKQRIRNKVNPAKTSEMDPLYIVDAFSAAAEQYSRDKETGSNGGLLGTLVPQGYCRAPELDKACFEVPLGEISGPIESGHGYHLILVTERINCQKIDGEFNKITRGGEGGSETVFVRDSKIGSSDAIVRLAFQQIGFWIAATFSGAIVAEVAAKAANVLDKLPWE
jgi:hypothetical protein